MHTEKENRSSGEDKAKKLGNDASKFEMLEFSPDLETIIDEKIPNKNYNVD